MQNNQISQESHQKPFWKQDPSKGFNQRVADINRYRDPTTSADELLRVCQWFILPLLLAYSAVLGGASYYAFFSHNFSPNIAIAGAVTLAIAIEFGKAYMGLRAVQKPFLQGWGTIVASVGHFTIWLAAVVFAVATFTMSIINSTHGGQLLATKSGQERHATAFSPTTGDIDAQITATEKRIAQNNQNKWKDQVTVYAQQANRQEAKTLASLQAQREKAITTQRADFERQRGIDDQNTATGSNMLMAAGGWVEGLQMILLFVIAACQSVLHGKMQERQASNAPTPYRATSLNGQPNNQNRIGFNVGEDGNVRSTLPIAGDIRGAEPHSEPSVPQSPQSVPQTNSPNLPMPPNDVVRFHLGELQKEPSNFANRHANQETVSARVAAKLKAAIVAISLLPTNCIIGTLAFKFDQFFSESLIPVLDAHVIEGEHRELIRTLREVISDRCISHTIPA